MASLRKAGAYSKKKARPYTRVSKTRKKAFIKTVPQLKVVKFGTGNKEAHLSDKHGFLVKYICMEKVQIRDNALEAGRLLITKILDKEIPGQFFFEVKVYPHHILTSHIYVSSV